MKYFRVSAILLWLAFASGASRAAEPPSPPSRLGGGTGVAVSNLLADFASRLDAAIKSRDLVAIQALYQTNGVSVEELKIEIDRWQQVFADNTGTRLKPFFKELNTLPPQARVFWTTRAHHMTTREVSHLAGISAANQVRVLLELPLAVYDDKLWIVPSDGINKKHGS